MTTLLHVPSTLETTRTISTFGLSGTRKRNVMSPVQSPIRQTVTQTFCMSVTKNQ